MIEIIPAILPINIGELRSKVGLVKDSVKTVHFDLCDGVFVPTRSWPYNDKDIMAYKEIMSEDVGLPFWEDVSYEFDLMIKNAALKFEEIMKMGPDRLIFHIEAEDDLLGFLEKLDPYFKERLEIGVAINTTTDIGILVPLFHHIKFVQCMAIEALGKQRQHFDPRVIDQIKKVRALNTTLAISVDGSVNKETAHTLLAAGATRLVIGSAIFDELDTQSIVEDFQNLRVDL